MLLNAPIFLFHYYYIIAISGIWGVLTFVVLVSVSFLIGNYFLSRLVDPLALQTKKSRFLTSDVQNCGNFPVCSTCSSLYNHCHAIIFAVYCCFIHCSTLNQVHCRSNRNGLSHFLCNYVSNDGKSNETNSQDHIQNYLKCSAYGTVVFVLSYVK